MNNILQLLAATCWLWMFTVGPGVTTFLVFCGLFSRLWWICAIYCTWIWLDFNTCMEGGRKNEWVRDWAFWKYVVRYYSLSAEKEEHFDLDPKKNYLFCSFPHGLMPVGILNFLGTNATNYKELFPFHKPIICTLNIQYILPIMRELILSLGAISASAESINYYLNDPEGGNVVGLVVGGAAEACFCKPNVYKLVLKNRKGFIKLALKAGTDILPVITFNETSVVSQVTNEKILAVQNYLKKVLTFSLVLIRGRYWIFPYKVPISILVGKPIHVEKKESPSDEEINSLHQLFIRKLTDLFENHKHKYIENASDIHLELV